MSSLFELYFRFRRFVLLVQTKKWFLWTMAAAEAAENHGNEWGLTWYLWWGIYTSIPAWIKLTKFTSSRRSTEFKDILPWNILQMTMKTIPINTLIIISYAMKLGIPFWDYWKVNGNWGNSMIRISLWMESHWRTNISVRRKKEIQKSRTVTVRDPSRKVNHLSNIIRSYNRVHQVCQFY